MSRKRVQAATKPAVPRGALVFDTSAFAPADRLDAWTDHLSRTFATFDFNVSTNTPFYGRLETLSLGPLKINRGDCSAAHWARLGRHLSDGRDDYGLCVALSGSYRLIQGDVDVIQQPNSYTLIDNGQISNVYANTSGVDYDIVVPRAALRNTQRVRALSSPPILNVDTNAMRLLGIYIDSIYNSEADFSDPLLAAKTGEHLLDLIVMGLQPTAEATEQARDRGLRAARLRSILTEIQRCFAEPSIGPARVAARVNMSESYLHKLLDERGLVFSRIVMELRLGLAVSMLSDPHHDLAGIGEIARQAGFNDVSYFNRCFRAQFGMTPRDMRSGERTIPPDRLLGPDTILREP
ncbi:helix-turn-helix domain-containing protein [Mesorhizobium sp. IMUNJ 23232]|uniref:helix-turn-helix domain-containing protein n=1 Tax=Mesorhizobium sp. IMUNJ 23232 TaxID=3376064 RepID=UPI003794C145